MNLGEYSQRAWSTADYPNMGEGVRIGESIIKPNIMYVITKLAGEAGELAEFAGKIIRDNNGILTVEAHKKILLESGDVHWYQNALAIEMGSSLSEIMEMNLAKLADRKRRGVIHGEGDYR